MGISTPREQIEKRMLELKYKRVEIQQEKEERLAQLKNLLGKEIKRNPIPDYIVDEESDINSQKKETKTNPIKTKKMILKKGKGKNLKKNGSVKNENAYERKLKKNSHKKKHIEETKQ